ncbi:MAG: Hsp70 family protein, partial [Polyangiaceae bacterium]
PAMPAPLTPVLVDVTPRALVVETVGGWCDVVVQRNSKIPCERTRAFATSSDMQSTVRVRVAQGEDANFGGNTYLGEVELSGLRPAPRGQVTIQVRFEVDESGTLKVFATDASTGREANATLQLVGIAGGSSISAMAARHAAMRLQ